MTTTAPLPNFFIIGASKAGTTSLFNLLKQHPQVHLSFNKEPMFFSHDDIYQHGLDWYARTYFAHSQASPARGEASPHYLYWSEKVAPRLHQHYAPAAPRFIAIFRDPVYRAYSWYWNMVRDGREDLSFPAALAAEEARLLQYQARLFRTGSMNYGYARGSCYATALQPFLNTFDRSQFLFLIQEDLGTDFPATLSRLQTFLQIEPNADLRPVLSNQATQPRSRKLQSWLRGQTFLRELLKNLVPFRYRHAIKSGLLRANVLPAHNPPLDPALEAQLRLQFAPEVRRLETLLARDLSAWLPK